MDENPTPRRGGLIAGVLFVTLGLLFLLRNFGFIDDLWALIGRYWPLLLILMGVAKIVEYLRGTSGRLLRFGEFVLVVFVILFGLVASRLPWQLRLPIGDRRVSVRDYYGNSFTFTQEATQAVSANPALIINNAQGSVTLVAGVEGQVRVKLRKIVYARSEQQARQLADKLQLVVAPDGPGWRIETSQEQAASREMRFETSFEIAVPPASNSEVHNVNGDVSLEGLTGNQKVTTSYGRLSLIRIQGNVEGTNKYGDSRISGITGNVQASSLQGKLTVENVSGDLTASNSYKPIEVSDIRGKCTITNSYSTVRATSLKQRTEIDAPGSQVEVDGAEGEVKVRSSHKEVSIENCTLGVTLDQDYGSIRVNNIGGDLVVRSTYTTLSATRVKGGVKIEGSNSSIDLEDVRGDASIRNRFRPVTLIDFGGGVSISNENADITLGVSVMPKAPITATSSYGTVDVTLPSGANFQLDARTKSGEIRSEFSGPEDGKENDDVRYLRGQVGGNGPVVKLETSYANIVLKKSSR